MHAIVQDKRRKHGETPLVCTRCGFPEIELVPEGESVVPEGSVKVTKAHKIAIVPAPASEEEALKAGWLETELGIICPLCAGPVKYEEAQAAAEGAESHVGTGSMATALAKNIAESQGETFEGQIADQDVPLPTVHALVLSAEDENHQGTGECSRCHKTWKYTRNGEDYVTDPPYTRDCILAPSTEMAAPPMSADLQDKKP